VVSLAVRNFFLFFLVLVSVLFIAGCTQQQAEPVNPVLDSFATCLKDSGLKMYGSMTCSVCKRQRALFGSSFEKVGEIECHPRGKNPQTQLCLQKDIQKTPTWILEKEGEEVKRLDGFQPLQSLAELSGCSCEGIDGCE
jgi:hypothetical protein